MALGLRIWDASRSHVIIDTSFRTGFLLGAIDITSANQSGSVTNPAITENGDPFYFTVTGLIAAPPIVTFSGNTLTWTDADSTVIFTGTIYYGVR